MAAFVFIDCFISINTVDLSTRARRVTVGLPADLVDATRMGHTARARLGGLKDGDVTVEFQQDFAAANVDATLFPLLGVQTAIVVRPVKGTVVGATNPEYRMNGMLESYGPLDGAVGDLATLSATFRNSDGLAPTRNTS